MILAEDRQALIGSILFHVAIVTVLIVKPYFSKEIEPFERTIKVDIVAMPEKNQKIIKEQKAAAPAESEKKEIKKKPEPKKVIPAKKEKAEKPTENVEEKAVEKNPEPEPVPAAAEMDAISKLKQMQKEKAALAALEKQKEIAGNRISKGSDLVGVEKLEYTNYKSIIHNAISSEWNLPEWIQEGKLKAVAHIKIDEEGNLLERRLITSSGNKIYDDIVMEAISDATPFDPPPEKFKNIVKFEGVYLTFP